MPTGTSCRRVPRGEAYKVGFGSGSARLKGDAVSEVARLRRVPE